jgi:hypothetical protein
MIVRKTWKSQGNSSWRKVATLTIENRGKLCRV